MANRRDEGRWHGNLRLMLLLAAVGWPAWHPLQMQMTPEADDPLRTRLLVATAALVTLALTWMRRIPRPWIERAFAFVGVLLTTHVFTLVRINGLNAFYIMAALIVLPAAAACMPSLRTLGVLLAWALILAAFATGFRVRNVADLYFLAAMGTEVAVLFPALAMRLRLTRELSGTAETLDTILDNAATGIARLDRRGHFVHVNRGFAEMLEQAPKALIGVAATATVHVDERPRAEEWLQAILAGDTGRSSGARSYYRVVGANARVVWVRAVGRPIIDPDGAANGAVVVFADVTKERELELVFNGQQRLLEMVAAGTSELTVLRAAVEMVREQIEPMGVVMLRCDGDGETVAPVAASGSAAAFLPHYDQAPVAGWAAVAGTAAKSRQLAFATETMSWASTFFRIAGDAGVRAACAVPTIGKKGQVLGVLEIHLGAARMPSEHEERCLAAVAEVCGLALERAQIERLIDEQKATITLSAKMASLGEMAAGIAHEINNPMTIIKGRVYLMRKMGVSGQLAAEELVRSCDSIDQTVQRVTKIIHGLKTFARADMADVKTRCSVATIVTDTLAFCSERFKARGIRLEVSDVPSELATMCRPTQLSQVLLNLLGNAFDAVDGMQDPWVSLEVRDLSGRDELELAVTDCGEGIPEETREKIFQPFFSTKEVGKGTGLGLSISLGIVKDHGGRLTVDTNCANTRFVLTLPKAGIETAVA